MGSEGFAVLFCAGRRLREMGDIPAGREDGAGADLPLPIDLPRRASVDGLGSSNDGQ